MTGKGYHVTFPPFFFLAKFATFFFDPSKATDKKVDSFRLLLR